MLGAMYWAYDSDDETGTLRHAVYQLSLIHIYQGTDEVYQRPYTFVQIGGASRPVVHLDVDIIIMVIYMPWAIYPVGPHSLQGGREIAGALTGN